MMANPLPDYEELWRIFHYDPETGLLTSKIPRANNREKVGSVVGTPNSSGFLEVGIGYTRYKQHRLIWKMMTGDDPGEMIIDHIDRDFTNNKWSNLRICTKLQNNHNRTVRKDSSTGHKNIQMTKNNTFAVRITSNKKTVFQKNFKTLSEAIEARDKALKKHHKEFANCE